MKLIAFILIILIFSCSIEQSSHNEIYTYKSTKVDNRTISKILFIGNSICKIPDGIAVEGFPGGYGMYASKPENDYCHLIYYALTNDETYSNMKQINIWGFEKDRSSWQDTSVYDAYTSMKPDMVIIQVGDNAASTFNKDYEVAYRKLILSFPDSKVICTSTVIQADHYSINIAMMKICIEEDITFVNIWDILEDSNCTVLKTGIPNCHPNDLGMKRIAEAILEVL